MTKRRVRAAFAFCIGLGLSWPAAIPALTIYPVDRAEILAGSQFDFKVEFDGVIAEGDAQGKVVTMRGYMAPPLKPEATFFVLTAQPVALCPFCQSDADWPQDIACRLLV